MKEFQKTFEKGFIKLAGLCWTISSKILYIKKKKNSYPFSESFVETIALGYGESSAIIFEK